MASQTPLDQLPSTIVQAPTRCGTVSGYCCPSCGSHDQINRCTRPYRAINILGILLLDWIGWLDAESDRRSWLKCEACGKLFRRRTSLLAWMLVWLLTLGSVAFLIFTQTTGFENDYSSSISADIMKQLGVLITDHPHATAISTLWIVGFTVMTLLILAVRVRSYRKRLLNRPRPEATITKFEAPSAGQF